MTPSDLHDLSLIDIGRLIHSRALSSVEVTQTLLDRIARLDGHLGSYATLTPELALAAAEAADREIAGGSARGSIST